MRVSRSLLQNAIVKNLKDMDMFREWEGKIAETSYVTTFYREKKEKGRLIWMDFVE